MRFVPIFALLAGSLAAAEPAPDPGAQLYAKIVRSTVWIHSRHGQSQVTGSGALIDRRRSLVLTNYHVVGEEDRSTVVFPQYRSGKLVAERSEYQRRLGDIGIKGRVVARDKQHDLAVIQLESVPAGISALPMADHSPSPGQAVHSIGNPGGSGALWIYTPGKVRQVYRKQWQAKLENRVAGFSADVIETDSPTNPGDSGGPLVNDLGELIGVTQGGAIKENSLSTFIDVTEVKKFLNTPEVRKATGFDGKITDRTSAISMHDGAKKFSPSTIAKANEAAQSLYRKTGRDFVIETYQDIPNNKTEEVKAMKPEERGKFYRDWAAAQAKKEDVNGILLLITNTPSSFQMHITDPKHRDVMPKLTTILREHFGKKEFDAGLEEFIKVASDALSK